ncbi:MAG: PAS domain S-box protein [Methanomassiliicoccales archaeon]
MDDDTDFLEVSREFLEERLGPGSVRTSTSAEEALRMLEGEEYDVVVSDFQMPGMDGLEFLRSLRNDRESDLPFVMFTGKGREEVAMKALNLGANRYLQKGGDPGIQYSLLAAAIEQEVEHHRRTRRLERSETEKRKVLESTSELIVYQNLEHEVIWANRAAGESVGRDPKELEGRKCYQIWQGREEPCEECPVEKALESGGVRKGRIRSPDGREWLVVGNPVWGEDGSIEGSVEVTLLEDDGIGPFGRGSDSIPREIFEAIPDPVFLLDRDGRFMEVNRRALEKLGFAREEIVNSTLWNAPFFPPETVKKKTEVFERRKRGENIPPYEVELKAKDGSRLSVEINIGTFGRDRFEGEVLIARNISERKRAEQRFRTYVERSPYGIFVADSTGQYLEVNRAATEITGYSRQELEGMNLLDLYDTEVREEAKEAYKGLMEEGEAKLDLPFRRKDGSERRWSVYAVDLSDDRYMGFVEDITEGKESEERAEFLHSLLRHDVRNKVQVVLGYLGLMRHSHLPEKDAEYLGKAVKGAEDITEIIEKVRILQRAQGERTDTVRMDTLVADVVEDYRPIAMEEGMEIEIECPAHACNVRGGLLLKELLTNVLSNSIRHSGGSRIRISGGETGGEAVCTIEDDGKGIPDGEKEKIFHRNYTTDRHRGSGLGLFLVKTLLDIYGGSIEVKDSELGGTRLDIHLKTA